MIARVRGIINMPVYPKAEQNLALLESLRENYSEFLPGFKGDSSSVVDFMKHLGMQGVEGMDPGKQNRADMLGLNQPHLAQPAIAKPELQTMAPVQKKPQNLADLNVQDDLLNVQSQPPIGDAKGFLPDELISSIAGEKLGDYLSEEEKEGDFDNSFINSQRSVDFSKVKSNLGSSSQLDIRRDRFKQEGQYQEPKTVSEGINFQLPDMMKDSGELSNIEKFQEKFRMIPGGDSLDKAGSSIADKIGGLKGKFGAMREKFSGLDDKVTGMLDKGSALSAKIQGPLDSVKMIAGANKPADATEAALEEVSYGLSTLEGQRSDVIADHDSFVEAAQGKRDAVIDSAGFTANTQLKKAQQPTSNIAVGSIKKKAESIRGTLADSMAQTVASAKTSYDAAEGSAIRRRQGSMAGIRESENTLKTVEKELKDKLKVDKALGSIDKVVGAGTLALDVMTGGTAGSAIRGGYKLGKGFLT